MSEQRIWSTWDLITHVPTPAAIEEMPATIDAIKPFLAGRHPAFQGWVLADLVALWLGGHLPPDTREEILEDWLVTVRQLVPMHDAALLSDPER
jgi:hypothetical protein